LKVRRFSFGKEPDRETEIHQQINQYLKMKKSKERRKKKCLTGQGVDSRALANKINQQIGDEFILTHEEINIREESNKDDSKTDLQSSKFSDLASSQSNAHDLLVETSHLNEES
jgi:hypothetical protein